MRRRHSADISDSRVWSRAVVVVVATVVAAAAAAAAVTGGGGGGELAVVGAGFWRAERRVAAGAAEASAF